MTCDACVYQGFPTQYSEARQTSALVIAVLLVASVLGGCVFLFTRRHEPVVAMRNKILCLVTIFDAFLSLYVPFREYYGETSMPCVLQFLFPNVLFALIPSSLIVQSFSLYALHLKQRVLVESTGLSLTEIDASVGEVVDVPAEPQDSLPSGGPSVAMSSEQAHTTSDHQAQISELAQTSEQAQSSDEKIAATAAISEQNERLESVVSTAQPAAASGKFSISGSTSNPMLDRNTSGSANMHDLRATHGEGAFTAFYAYLDRLLIYWKFHTTRSQLSFLAMLSLPRLFYYLGRIATVPSYRTWSDVGCRLESADIVSFLAIAMPLFVLAAPLLLRLHAQRDTLGLRYELALQLVCFLPLSLWYYVGESTLAGSTFCH